VERLSNIQARQDSGQAEQDPRTGYKMNRTGGAVYKQDRIVDE
jgi:hypothetical protein